MKPSFKNERKKEQQVLLPCIEFPGFKKITLESGIKSESLKREAAEQQLLYISYERQWQSQIRAQTGAPKVISGINGNILQLYQLSNFILSAELIDNVNLLPWQV